MRFVIFHGSFGSPESNWFPELKEKLRSLGQEVIVPKFPVDDWDEVTRVGLHKTPKNQTLQNWLKVFAGVQKEFKKGEKLCFIGHSLGPLFILHAVDKFNLQLDSAIFVSPFLEKLGKSWQIDLANQSFYKADFNFKKLKRLIPVSYVLYSDNDPYAENDFSLKFAEKMGSSTILVKNGGHLNSEFGFTKFPLVFKLSKLRVAFS